MSYIRCPECAFCIGLYSEFVSAATAAIYKEKIYKSGPYAKYRPEKIDFNPDIAPPLHELFDSLGIRNRCCRTHLLGKTEFHQMYK
jgi:DNA-directed RNA polymerase subunit N (RpoN/RPB10)